MNYFVLILLISTMVGCDLAPAPIGGSTKCKFVERTTHKNLKNNVLLGRFLTMEIVERYELRTGKSRLDAHYNPLEQFEWLWTAEISSSFMTD